MSFLSRFHTDVFISYSHIDNGLGWVTEFHTLLENRLSQLIGERATIWRDKKVDGVTVLWDEIYRQLKNTAVFLPILTPSYFKSEGCQKERDEFQRIVAKNGGIRVDNRLRIAKAVKTPLNDDRHREVLFSETLGVEFYDRAPQSQSFREFRLGSETFLDKFDGLAQEIASVLHALRSKETIYLAGATQDVVSARQKILDELQAYHYRVLPAPTKTRSGNSQSQEEQERVRSDLNQASLSIHLLGSSYDPDVAFQYEEARNGNLARVVCTLRQTPLRDGERTKEHEAQEKFLQRLRDEGKDDDQQGNRLDLIAASTVERLKDHIRNRLKIDMQTGDTGLSVYLICDRQDHPELGKENHAALITKHLSEKEHFAVSLPMLSPSHGADARKDHQDKLKNCGGVLLYWGLSSEAWLKKKLPDLTKPTAARKVRKAAANALYITDPQSDPKTSFDHDRILVIRQFGEFSPHKLAPFVQSLRREKGAAVHA